MAQANLLIIQGIESGTRFALGDAAIAIGRGVHNDLRVQDAEVSRVHARVERVGERYQLTDAGSANGTSVNGATVSRCLLDHGDQIQLGRSILVFEDPDHRRDAPAEQVQLIDTGRDDRSEIVNRIAEDDTRSFVRPGDLADHGHSTTTVASLQTLYRVSEEASNATNSLQQLLQRILDLTVTATGADRGCVLLLQPQTNRLSAATFSQGTREGASERMKVSRTIVDYVVENGEGVRTSDAGADTRFATGHSIVASGIREAICVPMRGLAEFIGVIYLDTTTHHEDAASRLAAPETLTNDHLKLTLAIARQAALAVERHRYQHALLKAERLAAVGQTITMLSHHVKNILQGVRGGSYLIQTGLDQTDNELVRQGWEIVDRNQGRIYNLVMDMLTFSTERKPALQIKSVNEVVGDVRQLMNGWAAECDVTLEFIPDETIVESAFDTDGIHRAILNVVTNAIDAVEGTPQGRIVLRTGYTDGRENLRVSVNDNGPGIPADQIASIFSLFSSTKGSRGTGLGLAVSRKILEEHGGRVEVESTPDSGTTFHLILPRLDASEAQPDSGTSV